MRIRKVIIALTATVLLATLAGVASAQSDTEEQPKWWGGIKAGINSSQFHGDAVAPWVVDPSVGRYLTGRVQDKVAGFVGGALVRVYISHWFGIQAEALYSQQGGDGTVSGEFAVELAPGNIVPGTVDGTLTIRMDYIELPLLASFEFPRENNVGFNVIVGPSFGYNVWTQATVLGTANVPLADGSTRVQDIDQEIGIDGAQNKWQISGVVGAALEFERKTQVLLLDVRYQFGVTSIASDQDTYNHTLSVTFGFMANFAN